MGPVLVLQTFVGLGTLVNVAAIILGSLVGVGLGNRLSDRTRDTVTAMLGLFTMVLGGMSVGAMNSAPLAAAVGGGATIVVLLSLLIGGVLGSELQIEDRVDSFGGWFRDRLGARGGDRRRFVDAFVTATLVFCVGPLAILGSLSDGLGRGPDQLLVKAVLDGFAAIAFASTLGIGVMASAVPLLLYQGGLTLAGYLLGDVMPAAEIDALTATGGLILIGMGLRLANIKSIRVGDLLPALVIAPAMVFAVARLL